MQFATESWNGRAIVFSEQLHKLESLALPTTFTGICSVESATHLPTFAVFSWSRKRFTGGGSVCDFWDSTRRDSGRVHHSRFRTLAGL